MTLAELVHPWSSGGTANYISARTISAWQAPAPADEQDDVFGNPFLAGSFARGAADIAAARTQAFASIDELIEQLDN